MIFFAVLYAILILISPSLGPIDDHLFLEKFDFLKLLHGDRFYILDGIEQFGVQALFGTSPFLFYFVNALEFLALFFILKKLVRLSFGSDRIRRFVLLLVLLSPGMATAYFRLLIPERLLVLCLSGLVLLDQTSLKGGLRKLGYIGLSLVAFFLKEPAFLLVGGLSFFRCLEKKERPFHAFMMSLCLGYLALYCAVTQVFNRDPTQHYGNTSQHGLSLLLKNIYNFAFNDPLVLFFALPFFLIYLVKQKKLDPYFTLIAGYFSLFLVLGIYQEYYLLPLLPFLLVSLGKHLESVKKPFKLALVVLSLNAALYGLSQISIYKNEPRGFFETINKLNEESALEGKHICYLGLNLEFSAEILHASRQFLHSFKARAPEPQFFSSSEEKHCDYFIDSPYNFQGESQPLGYFVVHESQPIFSIPNLSIKTWIKALALKLHPNEIINKNLFRSHRFTLLKRP